MKRILLVASLVFLASDPLESSEFRSIASALPGAPAHLLPASRNQAVLSDLRASIAQTLAERHGADASQDDLEALAALAVAAAEGPGWNQAENIPNPEAAGILPALARDDAASRGLAALIATPEGLSAIAKMTPQQIEAMALLALAFDDPDPVRALMALRSDTAAAAAWPAPEIVLSPPAEEEWADTSMLLRGWAVRMLPDGITYIYQDSIPGSEIEIDEGMVLGALGKVSDIRRFGDRVIVTFESGDTLSGPAGRAVEGIGIPPIPENMPILPGGVQTLEAGTIPGAPSEILLSGDLRTEGPENAATEILLSGRPAPRDQGAVLSTQGVLSGNGPVTVDVVRPRPRPVLVVPVKIPDRRTVRPRPRPGSPPPDTPAERKLPVDPATDTDPETAPIRPRPRPAAGN